MARAKRVLGITGNIATGKSTVVRRLVERGARHIDADLVYRDLVQPGQPLLGELANQFGDVILTPRGELDRKTLGAIVFTDPARLAKLDALTHPAVIRETDRRVAEIPEGVVIIDAVKLMESGHDRVCDEVWLVTAPEEDQIRRLIQRNGLSRDEAAARVAAQPPLTGKADRATLVIHNDGTLDHLYDQVDTAWAAMMARWKEESPE